MSSQILVYSGHLVLVQNSGLVFSYSLDQYSFDQQTSSHECHSDTCWGMTILTKKPERLLKYICQYVLYIVSMLNLTKEYPQVSYNLSGFQQITSPIGGSKE